MRIRSGPKETRDRSQDVNTGCKDNSRKDIEADAELNQSEDQAGTHASSPKSLSRERVCLEGGRVGDGGLRETVGNRHLRSLRRNSRRYRRLYHFVATSPSSLTAVFGLILLCHPVFKSTCFQNHGCLLLYVPVRQVVRSCRVSSLPPAWSATSPRQG